jgi:hypothetical protein
MPLAFSWVAVPKNKNTFIPADIEIVIPNDNDLSDELRCRLAYIPWNDQYLQKIPEQYHDFFVYVLPKLHTRTTDVHTALSVSQLPVVIQDIPEIINEHLLYLGTILHDVGWSEVSQQGIADSLSYNGLVLSDRSRASKQQHVIFGEALAYKLLTDYDVDKLSLSFDDVFSITEMIRRHDYDASWEKDKFGPISFETKLLCDCDRLWSYTHENFWLDTIRKMVRPEEYIDTIGDAIHNYFFTPAGKARARVLLADRRREVADYVYTSGPMYQQNFVNRYSHSYA